MPNPWLILGAVLVTIAAAIGGYWKGHHDAAISIAAASSQAEMKSVNNARTIEQTQQEKINETLKTQNDSLASINANLVDQLASLQHRANRPAAVPKTTGTSCAGTTGADLSKQDAGFLTREAARADRLRTALAACYEVLDETK